MQALFLKGQNITFDSATVIDFYCENIKSFPFVFENVAATDGACLLIV